MSLEDLDQVFHPNSAQGTDLVSCFSLESLATIITETLMAARVEHAVLLVVETDNALFTLLSLRVDLQDFNSQILI